MRPYLSFLAAALLGASSLQAQAANPLPGAADLRLQVPQGAGGNRGKTSADDMECLLEPHVVSDVGSPVEGTIAQLLVDRGATVHVGQAIARLNSGVEQATLNLKRAELAFDQREVARNEDLFKKNLIPANDRDKLETQARVAELQVKLQQAILNQRTILSPINGVVVDRYLAPGDHVSQEKIFKLAQVDPLNVEVVVPSELFGSIRPGMDGVVSMEPLIHGKYKAKVVVVDRVIDPASGTFGVRLLLSNPGNRIPAGLKCRVHFER